MRRRPEPTMTCLIAMLLTLGFFWSGSAGAEEDGQAIMPPGKTPQPTAISRLEQAGDPEDYPGVDHLIVYEETTNHVDEKGVTSTDGYVLYKLLTEKGCRDLSVLRWGYDPQSSWVDVREVHVIRDGERIPIDVQDVQELPAPQSAIYWNDRIKLLQLSRLRVGDGVEVRTFRKGFTYALLEQSDGSAKKSAIGVASGTEEPDDERFIPPMPGEYFDIVIFQAGVPTLEKRYTVILPGPKRLHSQVYNGALFSSTGYDAGGNVYSWWGFDIPAAPREPRQPSGSDYLTKVVLATVESWEAKSRWFFGVNEGQFDSTDEISEKVRQILEETGVDNGTDDEKAEALLHWVAQNIRYSGQTMGQGEGFTLHSGAMIFEQRSGVCKDIAGMLVTMLRAADIPAYPAMTMAGSRIEEVPADQFNHCVVARRADDRWIMYDPTWVPYNNDIWSKLETEQHYLIGSSEGEPLSRIEYSPPEESPLKVRHKARLDEDGNLEGTIRFDGAGAVDSRLRRTLTGVARSRLNARFAEILSPMCKGVEEVRVRHRVTDDFSGDMWIEVDYQAPRFAAKLNEGLEFSSPAMLVVINDANLFRAGQQRWPEERESDVLLYYTQLLEILETIELPRDFRAVHLPVAEDIDETYASFSADAEQNEQVLILKARAEVRRRQIPPDRYEGFVSAMKEARNWSEATVRITGAQKEEAGQ